MAVMVSEGDTSKMSMRVGTTLSETGGARKSWSEGEDGRCGGTRDRGVDIGGESKAGDRSKAGTGLGATDRSSGKGRDLGKGLS
jgi:hypothetical protein